MLLSMRTATSEKGQSPGRSEKNMKNEHDVSDLLTYQRGYLAQIVAKLAKVGVICLNRWQIIGTKRGLY